MQYRDVARLLVKTTGLIIFLCGLKDLPAAVMNLIYYGHISPELFAIAILPAAILTLTGLLIYWSVKVIVDRTLIDKSEIPEDTESRLFFRLETLCITVLGSYFLIEGILNTIYYAGMVIIPYEQLVGRPPFAIPEKVYSGLVTAIFRTILGMVAILYGKKFVTWRQHHAVQKQSL